VAKSKKLKNNDTKKLGYDATPWRKHKANGEKWKPPIHNGCNIVYDEPGNHWRAESFRKCNLLFTLEQYLEAEHALDQPLIMPLVMGFLGFDADRHNDDIDLMKYIWVFLVAVILNEKG
jgi:hypothetical protein